MIEIIIFSFNRALQLDTLLTSLIEKWKTPSYRIDILYNTTNHEFEQGYTLLKQKYPTVFFHKENHKADHYTLREWINPYNLKRLLSSQQLRHPQSDFRSQLLNLLKQTPSPFVMFLTDDSMFIRETEIGAEVIDWIKAAPYQRQYSLRMGLGMDNPGTNVREAENYITWNFYESQRYKCGGNWKYHFSVDGHIYAKEVIQDLLSKYIFIHPNSLEAFINVQARRSRFLSEGMAGSKPSILSYPINMVQQFVQNESLGVDCKLMNQWFLEGYTMKYPIPAEISRFQHYPDSLYLYRGNESLIKKIN